MPKKVNPETRIEKRKVKRKLRKRVYFIMIPMIFMVIVGAYLFDLHNTASTVFTDAYVDDGRDKSNLREKAVDPSVDNVSILIMGVDASNVRNNNDQSRTDTLMVATLNKDDKSVKLLSIPRDSYVFLPVRGFQDKINHAHFFGGPEAAVDAVENLLEIPIDYWVKLNFEAFIDVVEAVDGITVDVPYEFWEQDSRDVANAIHLLPGEQELNGEEALALARTRKLDNDIERGKRQQEIIKAVMKKAISVNSLLKYDDIIEAVGKNMATNMEFSEMKSFISYGTSGLNLDIETMTLEGYDDKINGTYYWQVDQLALNKTKELLQDHLDVKPSTATTIPGDDASSMHNASSSFQ